MESHYDKLPKARSRSTNCSWDGCLLLLPYISMYNSYWWFSRFPPSFSEVIGGPVREIFFSARERTPVWPWDVTPGNRLGALPIESADGMRTLGGGKRRGGVVELMLMFFFVNLVYALVHNIINLWFRTADALKKTWRVCFFVCPVLGEHRLEIGLLEAITRGSCEPVLRPPQRAQQELWVATTVTRPSSCYPTFGLSPHLGGWRALVKATRRNTKTPRLAEAWRSSSSRRGRWRSIWKTWWALTGAGWGGRWAWGLA